MLEEVELLVLRACPEVLTLVGVGLRLEFALHVDDADRALLAEGRIGQNHRKPLAGVARKAVHTGPNGARVRVDAVQVQVHDAEPGGRGHNVHSLDEAPPKMALLVRCEGAPVLAEDIVVGSEQEAPSAAGWIAHGVVRPGCMTSTIARIRLARGEVLTGPLGRLLRRLGEKTLVDVALHVGRGANSSPPAQSDRR